MSKINNPKVETSKGLELNDKDLTNSILTTLKNMEKNYAVALTEASNDYLFSTLKQQFDDIAELQREAFEVLFRNGWFILEEAPGDKVGEKYNTLNQTFEDLQVEDEEEEED